MCIPKSSITKCILDYANLKSIVEVFQIPIETTKKEHC